VIAGIVLAALGAFGYFGLQASISQVILSHIDEKQFEGHIQKTRDQAAAQLESIRKLQEETSRRTSLIVLQTDFGMKSAYMGALIGSIYSGALPSISILPAATSWNSAPCPGPADSWVCDGRRQVRKRDHKYLR